MKALIALFTFLLTIAGYGSIVRIPSVSTAFAEEIDLVKSQVGVNQVILTEGDWSSPASSMEKKADYFVIKTTGFYGGRILRLTPFETDSNGVTQPPKFTDNRTGEEFVLPYQTHDERGNDGIKLNEDGVVYNYFHFGVLKIDGEDFLVAVIYDHDLSHPMVTITWGKGSDYFEPGLTLDTFEEVSLDEPFTKTKMDITEVEGVPGVPNGLYVFVQSPKEYGEVRLETSRNLNDWSIVNIDPYMIYGSEIIYKVEKENMGFFRAIEL